MLRNGKVYFMKVLSVVLVVGILWLINNEVKLCTAAAEVVYGYCESPLNVREEMDVDSKWIAQYPADSTIILLEKKGEWYRVDQGYILGKFVFDSASIDEVGIVMCCSPIYGEANINSGVIGSIEEEEIIHFVRKKNGFLELLTGGWIPESAVSFDYEHVYDFSEVVLTVEDMKTWNMINMPMKYIGTLKVRTRSKGVTTNSSLYFKDSIPLYGVIDGYAYFPSGQHIYKISIDKFENIVEIGPKYETLAAYRTVYYSSSKSRKHNIELVSSILDGTIIPSNTIFSYNKTAGSRTAKKGYQIATVIQNGQYVDGYGGGVCQVSSTIYAAIMNDPNINVMSRKKHGLDVSYIPYGMDATVSYGSIDLMFANNYPFDIKLNIYAQDGVCMVTFTRVN